jgi:hypothetical protein
LWVKISDAGRLLLVFEPKLWDGVYTLKDSRRNLFETQRHREHRALRISPFLYPLEDFDYGMREFAIYDSKGYLFQFG